MRRAAAPIALLALVFGLVLYATPAFAHASLVSSDPAPNSFLTSAPKQISLLFAEALDHNASRIRLLDANGNVVAGTGQIEFGTNDHAMTLPLPTLRPGIYNVIWSNVSRVDGHALQGSFPFTILNPDGSIPTGVNTVHASSGGADPAPPADGVAVRAISLLGLATAIGTAIIVLLFSSAGTVIRRGFPFTMEAAGLLLAVGTLLSLAVLQNTLSGESLVRTLFNTSLGGYLLVRLGAVVLLLVAASFVREWPRRASWSALVAAGVYLWAYTQTSHAAAGAGSFWARGFDLIHAISATAWIGAVIGLAIAARLLHRGGPYRDVVPRFSRLASVLLFIALASGMFNAFVDVDTPSKLFDTRYGLALLIKLCLIFGALLPLTLYNNRVSRHRLVALASGEPRRFLVFAGAEAGLGILVFAAAAFLTQSTVARSVVVTSTVPPFDQAQTSGDLTASLHIDPNRTGFNTYRVTLKNASGAPSPAERVRLIFRYQTDQTVGASDLILKQSGPGMFTGEGPFLILEGDYQVEVEVRRANVNDVTVFFEDRPSGTAVGQLRAGGQWSNPTPGLSWNELGGIFLLVVGLGCAFWRGTLGTISRGLGWAANGGVLLGFGVGILLLFGVHSHTNLGPLPQNPIAADASSIATGKALFEQNCAACHGQKGVPPSGLKLSPYPLDLTVHAPLHSDGVLYNFIAHGIRGTAMPAWLDSGKLTSEQIWNIVNFLRTLGSVPGPSGASGPPAPTR